MWMDLETIIQSKVSQKRKKKNEYNMKPRKWYRETYFQGRNRDKKPLSSSVFTG